MPLLVCGAEGEWALFNNTLDTLGTDDKRRGSVLINEGQQMFKEFGATADCWMHVRFAGVDSGLHVRSARSFAQLRDTNGDIIAALHSDDLTNTDGNWAVRVAYATSAGSALTVNSENFPITENEFQDWDIRAQVTTVTNPNDTLTLHFYRNSQLRFTTTQTDSGGWAMPAQILLQERDGNTGEGRDNVYYQDVIVSDGVPTVGMELATLVPGAVGNYNGFDNDYTNIDDDGYDASTVIATDSTGVRESWVFATPTFDLGDKVIYAVVLDTVAQTDLAALVSDFQPFLRISATNYAGANLGANSINPDSYITIYTQNPSTSNPWQQSELTGLEAGILSV